MTNETSVTVKISSDSISGLIRDELQTACLDITLDLNVGRFALDAREFGKVLFDSNAAWLVETAPISDTVIDSWFV